MEYKYIISRILYHSNIIKLEKSKTQDNRLDSALLEYPFLKSLKQELLIENPPHQKMVLKEVVFCFFTFSKTNVCNFSFVVKYCPSDFLYSIYRINTYYKYTIIS
jgi:hypothetical protein